MTRRLRLLAISLILLPAGGLILLPAGAARAVPPAEGPRLSFQAEVLWLLRDDPDDKALLVDNDEAPPDGAGTVEMDLGSIDFDAEAGGRFTFGLHQNRVDLEVIYTGLHHWSDGESSSFPDADSPAATFVIDDVDPIAFGQDLTLPFEDVNQARMALDQEFDSVELNFSWNFDPVWGLETRATAGFRWIGLEESFTFFARDFTGGGTETGRYSISTDNDLYGFQIGGNVRRGFGLNLGGIETVIRVGGKFKVGIFNNDAEQNSTVSVMNPGFASFATVDNEEARDGTASLVEAGIGFEWMLAGREGLSFVAGYDVMRIGGLALAPEQISAIGFGGGQNDLDTQGSALYHGPYIGFQFSTSFDRLSELVPFIKLP